MLAPWLRLTGIVVMLALPSSMVRAEETSPDARRSLLAVEREARTAAAIAIERTVALRVTGEGIAGLGSGAVISADGIILTCAHVVDALGDIEAVTSDGSIHQATRLGSCRRNDFALIRIDAAPEGLPCFEIAPAAPALGDWVLAAGHPGGPYADSRSTVSLGRVTGLNKRLPLFLNDRYYHDAIRVDCRIYSGSSGGPLVDLHGRLLGINAALFLATSDAFAIPIAQVLAALDELEAGRDVPGVTVDDKATVLAEIEADLGPETWEVLFGDRSPVGRIMVKLLGEDWRDKVGGPWIPRAQHKGEDPPKPQEPMLRAPGRLGLTVRERPADTITKTAIYVDQVLPDSAAAAAGLAPGDRILSFDGAALYREAEFGSLLASRMAGDAVSIEIRRNNETLVIPVVLRE